MTEITSEMPDGKLDPMIAMMRKVLDFMRLTVNDLSKKDLQKN